MPVGDVNLTSFVISGVTSAVIAASVTVVVNVLLGGPMEVRKVRAVRRFESQHTLHEAVRLQVNAARLLRSGRRSWATRDGRVTAFTDDFDDLHSQMQREYQRVLPHIAATDELELEQTVGRAMFAAGVHVTRVQHFRNQAVGRRPDGLAAAGMAIERDLASAESLLEDAQRCLEAAPVRRRQRVRELRRRLDEIERRGPETPLQYRDPS